MTFRRAILIIAVLSAGALVLLFLLQGGRSPGQRDVEPRDMPPKPESDPSPSKWSTKDNSGLGAETPEEDPAEREWRSLREARLAFNTPPVMEVGEDKMVQLLISPGRTAEELKGLITEPGQKTAAAVKVSRTMEATLTGTAGVQVTAISKEAQHVPDDEPTEWKWRVTALKVGRHRLDLAVHSVIPTPQGPVHKSAAYTADIEVYVRPVNWLLWSGLGLLPVAALTGLLLYRRSRRGAPAQVSPAVSHAVPVGDAVFISYARADLAAVVALAQSMREAGVPVWTDVDGIEGAENWMEKISRAISSSKVVVLMISPRSMASHVVKQEIALAAAQRKPILPVVLEAAEIPHELALPLAAVQQVPLQQASPEENAQRILRALKAHGVVPAVPAP